MPPTLDLTSSVAHAFYIHEMARTVVDSPIGPLGLVASEDELQAVFFDGGRIRAEGSSRVLDEAAGQLEAYFDGDLVTFDLPLELQAVGWKYSIG